MMRRNNLLGPSFYREFSNEIAKYDLRQFQQRGYDEALEPDPFDPLVEMRTPEDVARRNTYLKSMNGYQRMAYRMGRVDRLELRGLYIQPEQSVFDVKSDPCQFGWTRHPILLVTASEHDEWGDFCEAHNFTPVDGYRCIYLGETSDGQMITYINECFSYKDNNEDEDVWGMTERLCVKSINPADNSTVVLMEDYLPKVDGYLHRSAEDATAAALKAVFDDWRDAFHKTPDQRLAQGTNDE